MFGPLFEYSFTMQAGPYDNLKDIAMKVLQKEVSTIPIIHSSSEDGSSPQLLHLASLSGILKCNLMVVFLIMLLSKLYSYQIYFQAFVGILGIALVHCLYYNFQSVQYLWAHGCPKSGNQIGGL